MARDDAQAVFTMSVRGATFGTKKRLAEHFSRVQRQTQNIILGGLEQVGERSVSIMRAAAPISDRDHAGRLRQGIEITGRSFRARFPTIRVGSTAVSERLFPYTNVTRFGRKEIVAKQRSRPSAALGSKETVFGDTLHRFSAASLKFPDASGKIIFRRRVGPWKPATDWVEDVEPQIRALSQRRMDQVSKDISFLLRRGFNRRAEVTRTR